MNKEGTGENKTSFSRKSYMN